MTKLLVQGDDYGFTKAVTLGIIEGIDNGILRNTGLFANMPSAPFAVSFMKDRPHVCFGIDFNIVSGPSVSDPKDIPSLVDEKGEFIRSGARLKDPRYASEEGRREMFPYEEVYREIRAQYDRFVELTGKKPGYLHGHSISHEHYNEAIHQVSEEEGVPYSADIKKKYGFRSLFDLMKIDFEKMDWTKIKKEFDPMVQYKKDTLAQTLEHGDYLLGGEYAEIGGHPGYVDGELMDLTTLSIERARDLQMMVSDEIKQWVKDNHIELITYYDLY